MMMNANLSHDVGCTGRLQRHPASQNPSDLYQMYLLNSQYPPILQNHSRTLAVPYKELRHHRSPCESIGNNYSPRGQNLKIQHLHRRRHSPQCPPSAFCSDAPGVRRRPITRAQRCRPLTPNQQLEIIRHEEKRSQRDQVEPTERDLERYLYYITEGIYGHMLAPHPPEQITGILKLAPIRFQKDERKMQWMQEDLLKEVQRDYEFSLRKSIVDYILLDPAERERLSISAVPRPFTSRVIRAPVPWNIMEAKSWQTENLYTVNPMLLHIQDLWMSSFSSLRFVRLDALVSADLPLLPAEFEELVRQQCENTRDELLNTWLPSCASLFVTFKDSWLPLVPKKASMAPVKAQKLFFCVAALMSLQLRSLVVASLQDLLQFFQLHQDGNDFGECFNELQYTQRPVLLVKLRLEDPRIAFEPSLQNCWELIQQAFTQIINSAHNIPRVEVKLFPECGQTLILSSVRPDESLVIDIINRAREIFQRNTVGPQRYLDVYKKYTDALDRQDILNFLKTKHSLQGFIKKITGVQNMWKEITSLHVTVPLSLFCLDAVNLNQDLCDKAEDLVDLLTTFVMEENRELNKRKYCQEPEIHYHHALRNKT